MIQVIANGNQMVSEETCEQNPEEEGVECDGLVIDQWVTSTDLHAPGHLQLEVIATDRIGNSSSERFWVDIPEPLPPAPGSPIPPKFHQILDFREEFGLEVVFPVKNEVQRNERIFNLINAWYEGDAFARATMEKWGVPLRPADVAELEFRERYVEHAAAVLPGWAASQGVGYAGYYVDHRQGGLVHVGFTSNQTDRLAQLNASGALLVPSERLRAFPNQPQHTLTALESLQVAISEHSGVAGIVTRVGIDVKGNAASVGATNPSQALSILFSTYGAQAPITAYADSFSVAPRRRDRVTGPVKAGDLLRGEPDPQNGNAQGCTAGFGAWDTAGPNPATGTPSYRHFILAAGHCFPVGWKAYREHQTPDVPGDEETQRLGWFLRSSYRETGGGFMVDAVAARLDSPEFAPRLIYHAWDQSIRINEPKVPQPGMIVCFSGITSNHTRCGPVIGPPEAFPYGNGPLMWQVPFKEYSLGGDSGAPVWEAGTGRAIGLMTAGAEPETLGETPAKESTITPLLSSSGHPAAPGILAALGTPAGDLRLVRWK